MGEKRKKKRKGKAECKSRWRGDENGTHENAETDEGKNYTEAKSYRGGKEIHERT
jgi:hypothetical protein